MMASWPMHLHQASFHAAGEARIAPHQFAFLFSLSTKALWTGTGCQELGIGEWRPPFTNMHVQPSTDGDRAHSGGQKRRTDVHFVMFTPFQFS
jgi:hypothetical protein